MAITTVAARQQILDELGVAIEGLGFAVACLGEAYEQLDTGSADQLEADLFRPAQRALARAKRTEAAFADRAGLRARASRQAEPGRADGARSFIDRAVTAAGAADRAIAELQDSMLPIEAGDPELRAGLAEVRDLLAPLGVTARQFLSRLGR